MRLVDVDNLNFEGQNYSKSQIKAILDFVDKQPTAYDVDKTLCEMKKLKEHYHKCCLADYNDGAMVGIEECMSIVRQVKINE